MTEWSRLGLLLLLLLSVSLVFSACGDSGTKGEQPTSTEGVLALEITGLPPGGGSAVTLTGPNGFSKLVAGTARHGSLVPGEYTIRAADVTLGGNVYEPQSPNPQTVTIVAGAVASAKVVYKRLQGFRIVASEQGRSLSYDQSRSFEFTLQRASDFTGVVKVALSGLPAGVSADQMTFALDSTSAAFEVVLSESAAAQGTFTLTITATSPGMDGERTLHVLVNVGPIVNSDVDTEPSKPGQLRYLAELPRIEGETITFDSSVFPSGERVLIELEEPIRTAHTVHIEAPEYEDDQPVVALTLQGGDDAVMTVIAGGDVVISNVEVTGARGLSVLKNGTLTVERSLLHENHYISTEDGHCGGALTSGGTLTVRDSIVENNSCNRGGGALGINGGTVNIVGSTFRGNIASADGGDLNSGNGGAVYLDVGTLNIDDSDFIANGASADGGAVYVIRGGLNVENSRFTGNNAVKAGGAIFTRQNTHLAVSSSSFTDNTADQGGAMVNFSKNGVIETSEFIENHAITAGGALRLHTPTTIRACEIRGNSAKSQGGLMNGGDGTEILQTTIRGNHATDGDGGGIYNYQGDRKTTIVESVIADNTATRDGGGIYSEEGTTVRIYASTIHGNNADRDGGGMNSNGVNATFEMVNSTVTENSAKRGGGIFLGGASTNGSRISFSTIVRNEAVERAAGIFSMANLRVRASIVSLNTAHTLPDMAGLGRFDGYNIVDNLDPNWTKSPTDLIGVTPALSPLTIWEDFTPIITFELGSPAHDAIPFEDCKGLGFGAGEPDYMMVGDQHGTYRPSDNACDIGAFEGRLYM